MRDITIAEYTKELFEQLPPGVLLAVEEGGRQNVMTAGWAGIGYIWRKPVLTVMVRASRYTYGLLEKSGEYTVNIPLKNDLSKAIGICGSKSGRDTDKFTEAGLTPVKAKIVTAPIIAECGLHYECKVVYRQILEPGTLHPQFKEQFYSKGDYHVFFYGEVLASYVTE